MSGSAGLTFPAGATLAGWWRQLSALQPSAWWVAHLFVHRVEATVRVAARRPLDPLETLLLRALPTPSPLLLGGLAPVLLRRLGELGLVGQQGQTGWALTEAGADALARGEAPIVREERRVFPFAERLDADGRRTGPPQFLPVAPLPARGWQPPESCRFDVDFLQHAIHELDAWKAALRFPAEVQELVPRSPGADWQSTAVVRPEHHLAVLLELPGDPLTLHAYPVRTETLTPTTSVRLFAVPGEARAWLGDFFPTPAALPHSSADEFVLLGDGPIRAVRRA